MNMRHLIPFGRDRAVSTPARGDADNPFLAFRRQMNRAFDDFFGDFDVAFPGFGLSDEVAGFWPRLDLAETDEAFSVTAELPGMSEKEVELLLEDGVLTLRGEKRLEREDADTRHSERFFGRFERQIRLPADVQADKAEAAFKNGVLTVTLPRSQEARSRARKIAIRAGK